MDIPMRITVVLCTYNRVRSLATALESIATQTVPQSVGWEILVVDNNSSDETRQVVEDFQRRYPERIRYLFEPQQGLSYARNAGVREAQGDILAFIDDDETADDGWLQNLTVNLLSGEWAGAGGRVLPQWNGSRPRWLSSKSSFALGPLAVFDPGLEGGQLTEPPFGANMAFRKEVFERYGRFRTDLGRSGKGMLSGEDTEFGRRLLAAGERMRYEPSALTYHPVDEIRVCRKYFLVFWFNKGRTDVREFGMKPNGKHLFGIPFRLFRDFAVEAVRWAVAVEPSRRFVCKLKVWCYAGQAFESYSQSLDSKRKVPEHNTDFRQLG
jgi:glycosyltransferase involved in cell wall biosynthesis